MELQKEISIEEVTRLTSEIGDVIRRLTEQLGGNFQPLSDDDLRYMISSPNTHLYIVRLKQSYKIVGMVTLIVYRIPYTMKAQLEDIVIDRSMRGKGIGAILMKFVIDKAKEFGVRSLNFTSSPKRESANKLYKGLGFKKRDTNVYRLSL